MRTKLFLLILFCITSEIISSDYFPLEVGNKWVWNSYWDKNEAPVEITNKITSTYTNGDTIFYNTCQYSSDSTICDTDPDFFYSLISSPNEIYYPDGSDNTFFLHSFVGIDSAYVLDEEKEKVEYIGQVSVTAGTFDSCYVVGLHVFAPNVGYIASYWDKTRTLPFQQEIIAYNVSISTKLSEIKTESRPSLYPNPIKDNLYINNTDYINFVHIYNLKGDVLIQMNNPEGIINLSELSSGIYFIELIYSDNRKEIQKIIKL